MAPALSVSGHMSVDVQIVPVISFTTKLAFARADFIFLIAPFPVSFFRNQRKVVQVSKQICGLLRFFARSGYELWTKEFLHQHDDERERGWRRWASLGETIVRRDRRRATIFLANQVECGTREDGEEGAREVW